MQGGFTKVAFRVPNERDDASTNKIEVSFPLDHPLPFVSVKPVPGWKVKVVEGKLPKPVTTEYGEVTEAVTKITWSGGKIEPGQFQEFEVSMGALPKDTDQLVFPTTQTYSGGEVVKWADEPKADGTEAERPAPTLKLVAAASDGSGPRGARRRAGVRRSGRRHLGRLRARLLRHRTPDRRSRPAAGLIGTAVGVVAVRRSRLTRVPPYRSRETGDRYGDAAPTT